MKLYTSPSAPNPRRVHAFLAEKGLEIPTEIVSLEERKHYSDEYGRLNPDRVVPTLVLDDGTAMGESLAICRYLEELHPDPPLFGRDAKEKGLVEMWLRRLEIQGYLPVQDAFRNSRPGFAGRALPGHEGIEQLPGLVARSNAVLRRTLSRLDEHLTGRAFIVGDNLTMADIVGIVALDFARRTKMQSAQDLEPWPSVKRWHAAVGSRPSFVVDA